MKTNERKARHLLLGSALLLTACATSVQDAQPTYRIDCNVARRSVAEVNEVKFTPWEIDGEKTDTLQLSGGVQIVMAVKGDDEATLHSGYYKAGVQNPLAKLISDGVYVENGDELELRITGLPKGEHVVQTYHNNFSATEGTTVPAFDVYAGDQLVHENQSCPCRVLTREDGLVLKTVVNVEQDGQEVVLRFKAREAEAEQRAVYLNGVEIDTPDILRQAQKPAPADDDMHADADNGLTLQWTPGKEAVKHHVYVGTDSLAVAQASTSDRNIYKGVQEQTGYALSDLYNLDRYYWRIDEEDASGNLTRGNVWSFRPRHLAFEGAEGYGRFAIGGRGGKVVHVTNLNDDGPGSFREAITNDIGPRTIVFDVSGVITLKSRLTCSSRYVTIAGQTAPGKGICIKGAPFGVGPDGICRFIRVRLGGGKTFDGIGMAGADHSITDHCSISWTIDEAFSSRSAKNITLQHTLISEALNVAGHKNYEKGKGHGYAATIGGNIGSFHHNLLAHCAGRNWSMGGGLDGNGFYAGALDIFNNVVYNWAGRATDGGAHEVNFVNNFYKMGPSTTQKFILRAQLEGVGKGSQSYYCEGNVRQDTDGKLVTDNEQLRRYELSNGQVLNWEVWVDKPFFPSYAEVESAQDAYKSTLSDVGCNMPLFDEHDQRIVRETLEGSYTYTGSVGKTKGIIDNEQDAGGYEEYPEEKRAADFDTDGDGLPDWWEEMHGTNPKSAAGDFSDSNADPDKDGYTNLEEYLDWMSVPHYYADNNEEITIDAAPLFAGFEQPTFTVEGDKTVVIEGSRLTMESTGLAEGIFYYNVTATDASGSSMTRRVGVCVRK